MIKHTQNILINSDNQKVWAFLIDFSRSLIFDRYYSLIELPVIFINSQPRCSAKIGIKFVGTESTF